MENLEAPKYIFRENSIPRISQKEIHNPETQEELLEIISTSFLEYEKKISAFFLKYPTESKLLKSEEQEFQNLRKEKFNIQAKNLQIIDQFQPSIMHDLGPEDTEESDGKIDLFKRYEKEQMRFRVYLFLIMHNFLEEKAGVMRRIDKNGRKFQEENLLASADAQQYIAKVLIQHREYWNELKRYRAVAKNYGLSEGKARGIERGILGLAGAYRYYERKGYTVRFPGASLDTKRATDLFLIDLKSSPSEIIFEQLKSLKEKDFEKLDDLPSQLRSHIIRVQVKCHGDPRLPTSEQFYDSDRGLAYSKNEDYAEDNFSKGREINQGDDDIDANLFFYHQCVGTDGRFLDLGEDDAISLIEKRKKYEKN